MTQPAKIVYTLTPAQHAAVKAKPCPVTACQTFSWFPPQKWAAQAAG